MKCECNWCTIEHPEYKQMMQESDVEVLRKYASRMFEDKAMALEENG